MIYFKGLCQSLDMCKMSCVPVHPSIRYCLWTCCLTGNLEGPAAVADDNRSRKVQGALARVCVWKGKSSVSDIIKFSIDFLADFVLSCIKIQGLRNNWSKHGKDVGHES